MLLVSEILTFLAVTTPTAEWFSELGMPLVCGARHAVCVWG